MNRLYLLASLALVLAFFRLGTPTLFDVDEAVFAEASREMLETGDWLTPTYNYHNRYDKPVLFYWLQASAFAVFGTDAFSARLPSALAGLMLLGLLYGVLRRTEHASWAFWSTTALLCSIEFAAYSHAAVTDMTLTLFISLSILSYMAARSRGPAPVYVAGFFLGSALAFLTKGLIGIVFPWAVVLIDSLLRRRATFGFLLVPWGVLLFLVVGLPWYLLEFRVNGMAFFNELIMKHHVSRFLDVNSGHSGSVLYYLPVLLVGFFPWVFLLPGAVRRAFTTREERGVTERIAAIWFLFVIVFFSFSNTKLPNYILSAFPPAAVLAGRELSRGLSRRPVNGPALATALGAALLGAASLFAPRWLEPAGLTLPGLPVVAVSFFLLGAVTGLPALSTRWRRLFPGMATAGMVLVLLATHGFVVSGVNRALQGELYAMTQAARARLSADEPLATFQIHNPSIPFYLGRGIDKISEPDGVRRLLAGDVSFLVISKRSREKQLQHLGLVTERRGRRYLLMSGGPST